MGFGSGGGGFTPSPNNVPGSTTAGTNKDTDTHQFTGSVDITGSLTLNGSSVSGGGGGGAVATYTNAGNDRVITSVNADTINGEANLTFNGTSLTSPQVTASVSMKAAVLEVSSSAEGALFRVDHSTQAGSKPIIFVTGSGLVAIGTDSPRTDTNDTNRLHILGESGADQGQNPAVNSVLVLENNDHVGLNIITPTNKSGMIVFGDAGSANRAYFRYDHPSDRFSFDGTFGEEVMTIARAGDSVNIGKNNADHMTTSKASLHISSSTDGNDVGGPVLLKVDHANAANVLFVTGSGRVGIGTATPTQALDVAGTANATTLSIGGTAIASTAAELNLLDAGATQHTASVLAAIPKLLKATYDFADQGGGAQTHTLTGSISLQIPDNAMIVGGWVDTETNPAPTAGTPTISFGMTAGSQTTIFLAATNYNEFASAAGGSLIPVIQATPVQYFKMPSASTITCTIASNTLTAGKLHIYLQYVVGA